MLSVSRVEAPVVITSTELDARLGDVYERVGLRAGLAGAVCDLVWAATGRLDTPPLTRFLAEQLTTAHWFDQRRTREALSWAPAVGLDEGFRRLASWYSDGRGKR